MAVMAKRKPAKGKAQKPANNPWPALLEKLQAKLEKTNASMATKFHVSIRTYLAWKYGEKLPKPQAQELIRLAIAGKY